MWTHFEMEHKDNTYPPHPYYSFPTPNTTTSVHPYFFLPTPTLYPLPTLHTLPPGSISTSTLAYTLSQWLAMSKWALSTVICMFCQWAEDLWSYFWTKVHQGPWKKGICMLKMSWWQNLDKRMLDLKCYKILPTMTRYTCKFTWQNINLFLTTIVTNNVNILNIKKLSKWLGNIL